jgi:beta-1,4-mannosyltransferase
VSEVQPSSVTLLTYPYYPDNAWQRIIYSTFIKAGGDVEILPSLGELGAMAQRAHSIGRRPLLHMNWTTPISQAASGLRESMDRVQAAIDVLRGFVADGGHVVWSIHNVLPHECAYLAPELILCRELASLASTIVVMNPSTSLAVAGLYPLDPAKVEQIDFPSYVGEYPDTMTRHDARQSFGLRDDDIVCGFVGGVRPYKGLEQLLGAFDLLAHQDVRQRLLIAGRPGPGYSERDLQTVFHPREYLTLALEHVPDDDIQRWMSAADLIVLPYTQSLNASVLLLAASFGRPVALRRLPEFEHLGDEPWIFWLEGEGVEFAESIARAEQASISTPELGTAARRFADAVRPGVIADRYLRIFTKPA